MILGTGQDLIHTARLKSSAPLNHIRTIRYLRVLRKVIRSRRYRQSQKKLYRIMLPIEEPCQRQKIQEVNILGAK